LKNFYHYDKIFLPIFGQGGIYVHKKIDLPCSLFIRSQHWHQSSLNWVNAATDTALLIYRRHWSNASLYQVLLVICQLMGESKEQNQTVK